MRQWVIRVLALLFLVPGLGMVTLDHALADSCPPQKTAQVAANFGNTVNYDSTLTACPKVRTPGEPVGAKSSRKAHPQCDLTAPAATFCVGLLPCWFVEPVDGVDKPPSTPKPTPDAKWHVRWCYKPGVIVSPEFTGPVSNMEPPESMWVGQARGVPSKAEQALEASGLISFPSATLALSPTARTFVNFDTWFWAQDLPTKDLRGTPALGLVAIATPERLEITPGDGSATLVCKVSTRKSNLCAYAYQRSSVGGTASTPSGHPAYEASGKVIWKLRFEDNGAPTAIAGAPAEVAGPEMKAVVEVNEIQTIVTG